MTPQEIVHELDKHIIGQDAAKRAVAIALRNRWRRQQVAEPLRQEITPKNILMIGPTGVGKTEIARRLAQARRCAVHQGGSDQVHGSRLRRARCGHHHARPGRNSDQADARAGRRARCAHGREDQAEDRMLDMLLPPARDRRPAAAGARATMRRARNFASGCAKASSTTRKSRSRSPQPQAQWKSWRRRAWKT